jgi:hypothetical protein
LLKVEDMKPSLTFAVRAAVLLALGPLPHVACGGAVETGGPGGTTGGSTGTTTTGGSAGTNTTGNYCGNSPQLCGSTTGTTTGTTTTGTSSGGPIDAGACDPEWISGGPATGGEVLFPCGLPAVTMDDCIPYCGTGPYLCFVVSNDGIPTTSVGVPWLDTDAGDNPVVVSCNFDHTGRRPAGLVEPASAEARSFGEVLAHMAYLEAAAIDAFLDLATQVEAHGAPASLVARLRQAAGEEIRHARIMGELARARGAEPRPPMVVATGARSLLSIALENAREGCVRETWGAACAVAQGERAFDAELRAAMRVIADDELSHAALSWDLAEWLDSRLTAEERAVVAVERERAIEELEHEIDEGVPVAFRKALGMPSREEANVILDAMRSEVWAVRAAA